MSVAIQSIKQTFVDTYMIDHFWLLVEIGIYLENLYPSG